MDLCGFMICNGHMSKTMVCHELGLSQCLLFSLFTYLLWLFLVSQGFSSDFTTYLNTWPWFFTHGIRQTFAFEIFYLAMCLIASCCNYWINLSLKHYCSVLPYQLLPSVMSLWKAFALFTFCLCNNVTISSKKPWLSS